MVLQVLQSQWSRMLVGIWFAFTNASILAQKSDDKKHFLRNFIVFFFIAATTIAVLTDFFYEFINSVYLDQAIAGYDLNMQMATKMLFKVSMDIITFIIPSYIFSKILHEKWSLGATVYFMYVIMDRMCMLLSLTAVSYLVVFIVTVIVAVAFFFTRMQYVIEHSDIIEWLPVLHYQLGFFFLLDALYGGYYIFSGAPDNVFDVKNLWMDAIAIVSFLFFAGFARLNIKASKEQAEKIEYMQELQDSERAIIAKFSEISEAKSGETGQHVKRVAEYSALLAAEYGFTDEQVEQIKIASMMHDVGKLLVPREIIEKPGKLTEEEIKIMRLHTTYGDEILANSKGEEIVMARLIASQHHERWDGTGYPNGLSGDDISPFAQIVAVADVYDALTSRRSYKEPWDSEQARAEIVAQSGSQFSPIVVEIFDRSFDKILEIQKAYADE